MTDHRTEPFVCLSAGCEPKIGECGGVIPLVGDLTFVDTGHALEGRNGVLGRISIEVWKLHDLHLHGDVGVGLNLSYQICSVIVALN